MHLISVLSGAAGPLARNGRLRSGGESVATTIVHYLTRTHDETEIRPSLSLIVSCFYLNPAEGAQAYFTRRRIWDSASESLCSHFLWPRVNRIPLLVLQLMEIRNLNIHIPLELIPIVFKFFTLPSSGYAFSP